MNSINVGDVVIPHRPRNPNRDPVWVRAMDAMEGGKFVVVGITAFRKYVQLVHPTIGEIFNFSADWVERVDSVPPDVEPDVSGFLSGM